MMNDQVNQLHFRIMKARHANNIARQLVARQVIANRYGEYQRSAVQLSVSQRGDLMSPTVQTSQTVSSSLAERVARIEKEMEHMVLNDQSKGRSSLFDTTMTGISGRGSTKLPRQPLDMKPIHGYGEEQNNSAAAFRLQRERKQEQQDSSLDTDRGAMRTKGGLVDRELETAMHRGVFKELGALTDDVDKLVERNISVLAAEDDNDNFLRNQNLQQQGKKKPRDEAEKKLKKMFKRREADMRVKMMPFWRHRLLGNMNPPAESVIKGKRLIVAVSWAIVIMLCRPRLAILKRKVHARDRERADLENTLILYAEACSSWIGKLVRVPVASIQTDQTLDFDPRSSSLSSHPTALQQRILQLKVRARGIANCLADSGPIPDHIADFLITLAAEEGNYFPVDYLWDYEKTRLEFNSLGAVREMIRLVSVAAAATPSSSGGGEDRDSDRSKDIITLDSEPSRQLDVSRVRMLIQNFLLIRILVNHVVLSPWRAGVCTVPSRRVSRVILNYRMLATTLYDAIRLNDPDIPSIASAYYSNANPNNNSRSQGQKGVSSAGSAGGGMQAIAAIANRMGERVVALRRTSQTDGAAASMPGQQQQLQQVLTNNKLPPITGTGNPDNHPPGGGNRHPSTSQDPAAAAATATAVQKQPPHVSRIADFLNRNPFQSDGVGELATDSIERKLIDPRAEYEPLPDILKYLMQPSVMIAARPLIEEWLPEVAATLHDWVSNVVAQVLNRRVKLKAERVAAAAATAL